MTANELKLFVETLRVHKTEARTRRELDKTIINLAIAAETIGKNELMKELMQLYNEIENIDTNELVKLNIFE